MATLSTVAVDFIANTSKYIAGLQTMTNANKKWSSNSKKDFKDAEDGVSNLEKSFGRFTKAVVSFAALRIAYTSLTNLTQQAAKLVDEAEKVGASAGQFAKLEIAAQKNGASIDDVKRGYIELRKSINEANQGNVKTIQSFKELGLSFSFLASQNPDQRFLAIADALSKVSDQNERARLGTELLGKSYNELAPLIAGGRAGIGVAGAGALSAQSLKELDAVSKSFERVSVVLDAEFKKAIVSIGPELKSIAEILGSIIGNLKSIGTVVSIAFAPLILTKFGEILSKTAGRIGTLIADISKARTAQQFFGGVATGADVVYGKLGRLTPLLGGLRAGLLATSAAFATLAVAMFKITGTIALVVSGVIAAMKGMQLLLETTANVFEFFGADETAKAERERAKRYQESVSTALALLKSLLPEKEQDLAITEATTKAERDAAAAAREAARAKDAQTEALAKLKKEQEDYIKSLEEFGRQTIENTRTPFEVAREEFIKLIQALDIGTVTIEAFKRRSAELKISLDAIDLERLRIQFGNGPFAVLAEEIQGATIAAQQFAQSEIFGTGVIFNQGRAPKGITPFATTPFEEGQKQELSRVKGIADEIQKLGVTSEEAYVKRVNDINAAAVATDEYGRSLITVEQQTLAIKEAQNELWKSTNPQILQGFQYLGDFADQFSRAIAAGQSFGDALSGVFKNILRDISAMILRTMILQGIMAAIGFINPVAGAAFGTMMGIPPGRANGGPVNAGMPYTVGEQGPEMFVPRENGYIVPNDMMPGESIVVNQTINIETGVSQTVRAEMVSLLPKFRQEAIASVLDAKLRGGSYAKGLVAA